MRLKVQRTASIAALLVVLAAGSVIELSAQDPDSAPPLPDTVMVLEPGARFVTLDRNIFCTTEEKFHEIMAHVARDENEQVTGMLQDTTHGCYPLAAGVPVTVVRQFITYVELRPDSMTGTIWTVPEALGPLPPEMRADTTDGTDGAPN